MLEGNLDLERREIYLYGTANDAEHYAEIDHETSIEFIKNMRHLESASEDPILIHQYSIGGDWCASMAIFDAIKCSFCKVGIITHGIAGSCGSVIPQAADLRISMPMCNWLLHRGQTGINSDMAMDQKDAWHKWEKRLEEEMMEIYISKAASSGPLADRNYAQLRTLFTEGLKNNGDWWLSSFQALDLGLCDGILGTSEYPNILHVKEVLHVH
jgi:ATP-dependent protease ClpP protease subunit